MFRLITHFNYWHTYESFISIFFLANFKDPGWNDPPTFTYDKATAIQANSSKKGISLNKRVAFPMSGNIPKENNAIDPTAPPADFDLSKVGTPPMGPVKLPPSTTTTAETTTETVDTTEPNLSSNDRLHKVVTNLRTVAKIKSDDEINKRINVMRNMWLDGKLDTDVQLKLHSLSEG